MQHRKKVVSKSQFRFFRDAARRIEAGGESPIEDMTLAEIYFALEGVDYEGLPERAGQAAPKAKRQAKSKAPATPMPTPVLPPPDELPPWMEPIPEAPPEGVLSIYGYRARHPEKMTPPVDQGEDARILSFDGYLARHPERKRRELPAAVGAEWFPSLFGRSDGQTATHSKR